MRTLGMSIRGLCELCEFDIADGPLLGECAVEFERAMLAGERYVASAVIQSFERISSRRLGLLDRLEFIVSLATPDGTPVARVRYVWMLPRSGRAT